MATIFRCDRCYKEIESREDIRVIEIPRSWSEVFDDTYSKELCMNCLRLLEDFIKPLPKVAER